MSRLNELVKDFERRNGTAVHGPNCPPAKRMRGLVRSMWLPSPEKESCRCHLLAHLIDAVAGDADPAKYENGRKGIAQSGIEDELRYVYNDLNNALLNRHRSDGRQVDPGDDAAFQGCSPESFGCFGAEAEAELMAESIRAYLQNPNYLKTVAPNVAARIRAAVNTNPAINRVIQFN